MVSPLHKTAFTAVGLGKAVVATVVEVEAVQPFASVIVTLYVPALAEVMLDTEGVAEVEVKPFGPVHE